MSTPGQAVLGVVGFVAGGLIGGGFVSFNPYTAYYGAMVGLMVGGALFPPQSDTARPTTGGQLLLQTSNYGGSIPVTFGRRRLSANLLWIGTLNTQSHEEGGGGGKGGGGGGGSVSYTYSISMAWGLCMADSPRKSVLRAWAGKDEITDSTFADCATVYGGGQTAADPLIAAAVSRDPVWKNLCYVVFNEYPLGNSPTIPNFTFEVADVSSQCFIEAATKSESTVYRRKILYADGWLYCADTVTGPDRLRISKVDPNSLEIVASTTFSSDDYGMAHAIIDLPDKQVIAVLTERGSGAGERYILEFGKADVTLHNKLAVGDVCTGSDAQLYVCYWSHDYDAGYAPITGGSWQNMWAPLAADTNKCVSTGAYGSLQTYLGGGNPYAGSHAWTATMVYDAGYYYVSFWGNEPVGWGYIYPFFKKNQETGGDTIRASGGAKWLCNGQAGALYGITGKEGTYHLKKFNKEDLSVLYDLTLPNYPFGFPMIFENDHLFYRKQSSYPQSVVKLSTLDWAEKASYSLTGGAAPTKLTIIGTLLILGQDNPIKLSKENLVFICQGTGLHWGSASYATDGDNLFVGFSDAGMWYLEKFQFSLLDVTPQTITRAIITNKLWGLGLSTGVLETTKTAAAEAFATEKDLLMSVVFDHQRSVLDGLQYVLQHHDGFITYMNGQIAHRQLTMEGEAVQFTASTRLTDDFADGVKGEQWEKIE